MLAASSVSLASQGSKIKYEKVEICDSGYCDMTECQITMTDTRNIKRVKTYAELAKHQPRICELLKAGEQITMKYKGKSVLCIQDAANSDFELNYVEIEDCEFYRYGR